VTVYGVVVGASSISGPPTNDEVWIEVEYLGSSATPLGKIITTTKANVLAAGAAGVSDTSTWSNLPTTRAAVTTMFDASVSIQATLSNGNLTATHSQTANTNTDCAGTLFPRSSGKYYCEFTIGATHGATDSVGCNLSANTFDASNSANTITYIKTGAVWVNSSNALGNIGTWTTADVIGMAVDLDNRKVWFRKNGGNWNNAVIGSQNPATNTGGASITVAGAYSPYVGFNGSGSLNTDNVTANFGATSYGAAAPAGFGNWLDDGVGVAIFKLTTTLSAPQPGLAGYLNVRVRAAKASATYYIDPKIALS